MKIHRSKSQLRLLLTPLVFCASGCTSDPEPCFGLQLNEPLLVHVVNEYSEAAGYDFRLNGDVATPACPAALQLKPESLLDVHVVAQELDHRLSCVPNTVDVTSAVASSWEPARPRCCLVQRTKRRSCTPPTI